ncbi:unnamed protein product [marine sediment metagenome]|uniref:Uncharacterized protein n=1 Tax=marine sediment metagenome TaxID=412755 RepID=X1THV9_9ZZZZ
MRERGDYLAALARMHFNEDPNVAMKDGLRTGIPRDAFLLV